MLALAELPHLDLQASESSRSDCHWWSEAEKMMSAMRALDHRDAARAIDADTGDQHHRIPVRTASTHRSGRIWNDGKSWCVGINSVTRTSHWRCDWERDALRARPRRSQRGSGPRMLALTLCRSGADSGGYPSRKTDTCDGVTRRLVSCALSSLKGCVIR